MKKILPIALALVLILTLCAGCGNRGESDDGVDLGEIAIEGDSGSEDDISSEDDIGSGDSGGLTDEDPPPPTPSDPGVENDEEDDPGDVSGSAPKGWPDEIPVYPEGDIHVRTNEATNYFDINIKNSSRAVMDEYAGALADGGWVHSGTDDAAGWLGFSKGNRELSLMLMSNGTTVCIAIQNKP